MFVFQAESCHSLGWITLLELSQSSVGHWLPGSKVNSWFKSETSNITSSWPGYWLAKEPSNGDSKTCLNSKSGLLRRLYPHDTVCPSNPEMFLFRSVVVHAAHKQLGSNCNQISSTNVCLTFPQKRLIILKLLGPYYGIECRHAPEMNILKVSSCGQKPPKGNLTSPNQCFQISAEHR